MSDLMKTYRFIKPSLGNKHAGTIVEEGSIWRLVEVYAIPAKVLLGNKEGRLVVVGNELLDKLFEEVDA